MSLTPFRASSFFPGLPRWGDMEREAERDLSRINRMFSDVANRFLPDKEGVLRREPNYTYEECAEQAEIEVELPGVAKENVTVDLQGDHLTLSAKRYKSPQLQKATENGGKGESKKEAPIEPQLAVMYQLNIPVGNKFDCEKIHATMLGDGILTMVIPKKVEHAGPSRMIAIGSA